MLKVKSSFIRLKILVFSYLSFIFMQSLLQTVTDDAQCKTLVTPETVVRPARSIGGSDEIIIGVMTTRRLLMTRAQAVASSWGSEVKGRLVFYIGDAEDPPDNVKVRGRTTVSTDTIRTIQGFPVVQLVGVNDTAYPPRDKSFAMLEHMHRKFSRHFRWFVRIDDDVYIRYEKLATFLLSLDSDELWYLGHQGFGTKLERGHLGLVGDKPFCMGGSGVVLSSSTLHALVPHLPLCSSKTVTAHEDTELGRCLQLHLNLSCSSHPQAQKLFHHDTKEYLIPLSADELQAATLHPVKDPAMMLTFHAHFLGLQRKQLRLRQKRWQETLKEMESATSLAGGASLDKGNVGRVPDVLNPTRREKQGGTFISANSRASKTEDFGIYDVKFNHESMKARYLREPVLKNMRVADTVLSSNKYRIPHSVHTLLSKHALRRDRRENDADAWVDELEDVDFLGQDKERFQELTRHEDTAWIEHAHPGDVGRMSNAIRSAMHRVLVQLEKISTRRDDLENLHRIHVRSVLQRHTPSHGLQHIVEVSWGDKRSRSFFFSAPLEDLLWREMSPHFSSRSPPAREDTSLDKTVSMQFQPAYRDPHHQGSIDTRSDHAYLDEVQEELISLQSQFAHIGTSRWNIDTHSLHARKGNMLKGLTRVPSQPVHTDTPLTHTAEDKHTLEDGLIPKGSEGFSWPDLHVLVTVKGRHDSLARFLDQLNDAARNYPAQVHLLLAVFTDEEDRDTSALTLTDHHPHLRVTVVPMTSEKFSRSRGLNMLAERFGGRDVLVLLDVDVLITAQSLQRMALHVQSGWVYFPVVFSTYSPHAVCYGRGPACLAEQHLWDFSLQSGVWRNYGYGMVALLAEDFKAVGSLDGSIVGWGMEDVKFYSGCVQTGLHVFWAPDPGLVHVYHRKACDSHLPANRRAMCQSSDHAQYGSQQALSLMVLDTESAAGR